MQHLLCEEWARAQRWRGNVEPYNMCDHPSLNAAMTLALLAGPGDEAQGHLKFHKPTLFTFLPTPTQGFYGLSGPWKFPNNLYNHCETPKCADYAGLLNGSG